MKQSNVESSLSSPSSSSSSSSKICMVCGDKALGHNFNAITCESCKAFFRRNALSTKPLSCPFTETCSITVVTRRFCQKCRLEKCFAIGMKKEHIMSEEEKIKKRRKIEQNRAKKGHEQPPLKIKKEKQLDDLQLTSSPNNSSSTMSFGSPSNIDMNLSSDNFSNQSENNFFHDSTFLDQKPDFFVLPTVESSPSEIVNSIIQAPVSSTQVINHLMKTPQMAIEVMDKILNSPKDAIQLISHVIGAPGDALKIISKIMNSPFDALTIFTKFMSSPTDALEFITKIISSPNDVLQFLQQLMRSPEDGLQIMNKFINSPGEALKMINKMMNQTKVDSTTGGNSTPEPILELDEDSFNNGAQLKLMLEKMSENLDMNPVELQAEGDPVHNVPTSTLEIEEPAPEPEPGPEPTSISMNSIIDDIITGSMAPDSLDSILCEAIKLEYEGSGTTTAGHSRELNDAERAKLNELIVANKALYAPVEEDLSSLISDDYRLKTNQNQQDPQLLKLINLTAVAIRRLIKMSKKISAFKNMCQEDQVALLKGGCTEMMLLRSVMQYDSDRASWKIPHTKEAMSSLKADVLKLAKGNVYEEHERFILTFDPKWREDENINLIMCAIILFTPDRPKTIHSDVIKLEQNSYYYLLRRYLESIYPGCEAKSTFLNLIKKGHELRKFNEAVISVYLDVNPSEVEPLLCEIFDMKN